MIELNKIYNEDNLCLMNKIEDNSIDLIYCDILYGTGKNFKNYKDLKSDKEEIYNFYFVRINEMRRILKFTGSIYLQCDCRINHWIRCILDDVFGYNNFQNEIIWCYNGGGITKKHFNRKHDNILFYTKSKNFKFHTQYQPYNDNSAQRLKYKHKGKDKSDRVSIGTPMTDWWTDIKCIANPANSEYANYKTQKPESLVERIITASSDTGDIVADFFCGSGTTLVVAKNNGRNFIGCDISEEACRISEKRVR